MSTEGTSTGKVSAWTPDPNQRVENPLKNEVPTSGGSGTDGAGEGGSVKSKCDPHGLNGRPLPEKEVTKLMRTLHPSWQFDREENAISREVVCNKMSASAPVPAGGDGAGSHQARDAAAAAFAEHARTRIDPTFSGFELMQRISMMALTEGHYPYKVEIAPKKKTRRSKVTVTLKTVSLGGLSYEDFMLAFKIDMCAPQFHH